LQSRVFALTNMGWVGPSATSWFHANKTSTTWIRL